jgi:hypothetical protein
MDGRKTWMGSTTDYVSGARSDKNGKANTEAIIAAVGTAGDGAIQLCNRIGRGWFLPAYEELYAMSYSEANSASNNLPGAKLLTAAFYWSSTEFYNNGGRYSNGNTESMSYAVAVYGDGGHTVHTKSFDYYVRCAWRN